MNIDQQLDAKQSRRMTAQDRYLTRREKREAVAETMIGELCKEGKTVYYVWPQGGKYREGDRYDLIAFLIRNKYA
jgi:hypothetical protein